MLEVENPQILYKILGTVGIDRDGHHYSLTARKPRTILSLLMLNANEVVPTSVILEELWGVRPPNSAYNTLHTYIFQIRRWLSDTLGTCSSWVTNERLVTEPGGYVLKVPDQALDLCQFECFVRRGTTAVHHAEYDEAVHLFDQALELWGGGVPVAPRTAGLIQAKMTHLQEKRMLATEQRIGAELALGRHREVIGELSSLVINHPMHESLHAKLMIAFYQSGRMSDALDVYRRLRQSVVDDLGLEPCREVQSIHEAILSADTRLKSYPEMEALLEITGAGR
jgi:DNA-binding SARP family transcriptional activator